VSYLIALDYNITKACVKFIGPNIVIDEKICDKIKIKEVFEIANIQFKPQRCGKPNCKCTKEGALHGGYYWLVTYVPKQGNVWKYLGKSPVKAMAKLRKEFPEEANKSQVVKKLEEALKLETLAENNSKASAIKGNNKATIAT
jgi:hypothetical protein